MIGRKQNIAPQLDNEFDKKLSSSKLSFLRDLEQSQYVNKMGNEQLVSDYFLKKKSMLNQKYGEKKVISSQNCSCAINSDSNHIQNQYMLEQKFQNKIKELQQQLEYKERSHKRQIQNIKIFLEHEFNMKQSAIKQELRRHYHQIFMKSRQSESLCKNQDNEISMLKNKIVRLDQYIENIQQERQSMKTKHKLEQNKFFEQIKSLKCSHKDEIQKIRADIQVQNRVREQEKKDQLQFYQKKISQLGSRQQELQNTIKQLKDSNIKLRIQIEEIKIEKNRTINELEVRLKTIRENTVSKYIQEGYQKRCQSIYNNEHKKSILIESQTYSDNLRQQIQMERQRLSTIRDRQVEEYSKLNKTVKFGTIKKTVTAERIIDNLVNRSAENFIGNFFEDPIKKPKNRSKSKSKARSKSKSVKKEKTEVQSNRNKLLNTLETNLGQSQIGCIQLQSPTFAGF